MRNLTSLSLILLTTLSATAQTSSDFMTAFNADTEILFDTDGEGGEYRVNWGMDTAWDWDFNVNRGVAHIGMGNFATGRVSFQPNDLVTDNGDGTLTLSARQREKLKWRCDLIKLTGAKTVNLNCDHEALFSADGKEDFTGRANYQGKPEEWHKLIKATAQYVESQGLRVVSVSPFNEPDYVWQQATSEAQAMRDFLAIAQLLRADPYFDGIRISGGNTLNCDRALPWYNYLKDAINEGNTHQLAGSFDSYADFFTTVRADGSTASADELHNVGEAIVGVNYGMQNGIWWGFDGKARGQFCIDSNEGVRIGYGENRKAWTCGAVYRNETTGEVHGFLGSSERQAATSTFAFVSETRDVYFNGHGPTRAFVYEVPGGTGYQKGQINAERLFDITWGDDVAPFTVDGTYQIMNLAAGKMLTCAGTANVKSQTRKATGTSQLWRVTPGHTTGDMSYWFVDNAAENTTHTHLNVLNNNTNAGAGVICYDAGHDINEQWYIKYAGQGAFHIISRLSNKYLYCSSSVNGTDVKLADPPTLHTAPSALKRYLWRFLPPGAKADLTAPDAPATLSARRRAASVELEWTAPTDEGTLTYTILRTEVGDDDLPLEYNTIGRNVTGLTFVDNTALAGHTYRWQVLAVDEASNRSLPSPAVTTSTLAGHSLICQLQFDKSATDLSPNRLNASFAATPVYNPAPSFRKSGTHSVKFDGQNHAALPHSVVRDEMTVAVWVRWNGGAAWQRVFDFGSGTARYMFLTPNGDNGLCFAMKDGTGEQTLATGTKLASGWHHLAVAIRAANGQTHATLYVDGVPVAERTDFTASPSSIAPALCYIGKSQYPADPRFNGYMDDFRVYNYALPADEVADVMTDLGDVSAHLRDSYEDVSTDIPSPAVRTTSDTPLFRPDALPASGTFRGVRIGHGIKVWGAER